MVLMCAKGQRKQTAHQAFFISDIIQTINFERLQFTDRIVYRNDS